MSLIIPIAVFVGVAALVGGVAMLLRGRREEAMVEDRLAHAHRRSPRQAKTALLTQSVLHQPLDATQGILGEFLARGFATCACCSSRPTPR